jgi:hypothetical protein
MRTIARIAFAAVLPWAVFAQSDFNWSGTLSPGQTLEIKGVNGSIHAELASGVLIEVSARRTAKRSDPNSVRIETVPSANGMTICTVYPGDGSDCQGSGKRGHSNTRDNDVSVDYTVRVPAGIHFVPTTVNGRVVATGLRSDVDATTVNGNVEIATTGLVHATTVNGSIQAKLGVASWNGSLGFTTVNGSIDLTLPPGTSADVHATTMSGNLSSDFPLTVNDAIGERNMTGRIGSGGRELKLTTVNGTVTLHQGT